MGRVLISAVTEQNGAETFDSDHDQAFMQHLQKRKIVLFSDHGLAALLVSISERSVICPASPAEVAFCQDELFEQPSENRLLYGSHPQWLQKQLH
jgi:hypothetical protein